MAAMAPRSAWYRLWVYSTLGVKLSGRSSSVMPTCPACSAPLVPDATCCPSCGLVIEPRANLHIETTAIEAETPVAPGMSPLKKVMVFAGTVFAAAVVVIVAVALWEMPPQPFDDPNPAVFGSPFGVVTKSVSGEISTTFAPGAPIEFLGGQSYRIRMPGALLIVDVADGADLGGTRFERGAMVVVGTISGRLVYRRARPNDKVVLSQPNVILGRSFPAGPISVPRSGNLLSLPR